MKAVLKFNLPEDQETFNVMYKGVELYLSLLDLDNYLRNELKYNHKHSDDVIDTLDKVRDQLHTTLSNYDCSLDMMS